MVLFGEREGQHSLLGIDGHRLSRTQTLIGDCTAGSQIDQPGPLVTKGQVPDEVCQAPLGLKRHVLVSHQRRKRLNRISGDDHILSDHKAPQAVVDRLRADKRDS